MNKFLLFLFLLSISVSAQNSITTELDSIANIEQAETYLELNKSKNNKLITFNEEKHKTSLTKDLLKLSQGGVKVVKNEYEKMHYKVIEKNSVLYYRVSYIFLDGKKLSHAEINTLRTQIIQKYKNRVPFSVLAEQYSMDGNASRGGDSGWYAKGEMHPVFEEQTTSNNYNVDDIYTIDIADKNWYYVILKSFEPKALKEVKVLKIVESLNR